MNQITCRKKQRLCRSSSGSWTESESRNHAELSAMNTAAVSFLQPGELSGKFSSRAAHHDFNIRRKLGTRRRRGSWTNCVFKINVTNESAVVFNIQKTACVQEKPMRL
ncbi:uncharacterized [Tachysurus ichikawai]